jgi:hypothetical protein
MIAMITMGLGQEQTLTMDEVIARHNNSVLVINVILLTADLHLTIIMVIPSMANDVTTTTVLTSQTHTSTSKMNQFYTTSLRTLVLVKTLVSANPPKLIASVLPSVMKYHKKRLKT